MRVIPLEIHAIQKPTTLLHVWGVMPIILYPQSYNEDIIYGLLNWCSVKKKVLNISDIFCFAAYLEVLLQLFPML